MDHLNVSFEWQGSSAVEVLDFNEMEYDYADSLEPLYIEMQNVAIEEISEKTENSNDQYKKFEILDDISSIPSYGSFVNNLTKSQNDSFESVTNSTRIEEISARDMSANIMNKCALTCTCESCLQMFDHNGTEEPINVTKWEDITNNLYDGDLPCIYNHAQAESTIYMALPPHISTPNDSVKLRLRSKILAKSNVEAKDAARSCFCDIVSNS